MGEKFGVEQTQHEMGTLLIIVRCSHEWNGGKVQKRLIPASPHTGVAVCSLRRVAIYRMVSQAFALLARMRIRILAIGLVFRTGRVIEYLSGEASRPFPKIFGCSAFAAREKHNSDC